MKTIVTTKKNRADMTCIIGGIHVSFSKELEAEVEEKDVNFLLERDSSLFIKGQENQQLKQGDEGSNSTSSSSQTEAIVKVFEKMVAEVKEAIELKDSTKAQGAFQKAIEFEKVHTEILDETLLNGLEEEISKLSDGNDISDNEIKSQLMEMKMDELKQMASDSKLPEEDYKGLKKKEDLVNYLIKNIQSEDK